MPNLTKSTKSVKEKEINRSWHLYDAQGKILGRLATQISQVLIGKHKLNYVSHLDMGDNAVVINASEIKVTGDKEKSKIYTRYSGYPGGLKKITFSQMKEKKPEEVIRHAVYGMIPKNKLRDRRISRLHVYKNSDHPFKDKFSK